MIQINELVPTQSNEICDLTTEESSAITGGGLAAAASLANDAWVAHRTGSQFNWTTSIVSAGIWGAAAGFGGGGLLGAGLAGSD